MGYCSADDVLTAVPEARLAELTADSGVTVDDEVLADVIAKASGDIDRYLGGRYETPVTDPVSLELLKPPCLSIVKFKLFGRRDLALRDDPTRVEYDEAIRWLRDVSRNDASLPPSAALAGGSPESAAPLLGSDEQVFG